VSRTADDARRAELLEKAVDYVCSHGLAELSLRPLAKAVRSSPRVLLYYFGSKEALVVEIVRSGRARQRAMMADLKLAGLPPREVARRLWRQFSKPDWEPLTRLSVEVYAMALNDPSRFPGFADGSVSEWLDAMRGCTPTQATMLIAGFRGFLMDLLATHDRARINRAVDRWLAAVYDA
jgi:AcrR family transcriptional regulator